MNSRSTNVNNIVAQLFSNDNSQNTTNALTQVPTINMSTSTSNGINTMTTLVSNGIDNASTTDVLNAIDQIIEDVNDGAFPPQYQNPDYICGSISDVLSEMTSNLFGDAQVANQITNYLSSSASAAINDALRASGVQQLQTELKLIENEYSSLKNIFTTKIDTSNGVLSTSMNIINRAENIVNTLDRLDNYANDILNHIENIGSNAENIIENIPNTLEATFNNFQNTLKSLSDFDLSSTLDKLPTLVSDKFLDLDIIKDPLVLLNNVQSSVVSVAATVSSIRAPQNFNDVRALLSTLRGIIGQINSIKSQAERVMKSSQNLANTLRSGNYISLVASLAAGGVSFFERAPSYNAVYPHNHGYKTHGGHVFEQDNTPGSQRLNYMHPSNTSVEVQPDGGIVLKGKSDFQLSVSKNCDILVKNAATITVEGDAKIIANNVNVESKGNTRLSSSGETLVNAVSTASVVAAGSVVVSAGGTATVSSVGGTSISSTGPLTLSSNSAVNIISDGAITMTAASQLDTIAGAVVRNNASSVETSGGMHKINAGVISLN